MCVTRLPFWSPYLQFQAFAGAGSEQDAGFGSKKYMV
jgi:hypothetical protein